MLSSMTGFGTARGSGPGFSVGLEVRSVNNRHLKIVVRGTEPYPLLESEFEKIVRRTVRRGSVLIHVRVDREPKPGEYRLDTRLLRAYLEQLRGVFDATLLPHAVTQILRLPGVAPDVGTMGTPDDEWPTIETILVEALSKFELTRREEGKAMASELLALHKTIAEETRAIRELLPRVMSDYRNRLLDRVRGVLAEAGSTIDTDHVIRETALFADRSDVSEELTRLTAHLEQYCEVIRTGADGVGRRLEFIVQEMGREVNTLGSKAGDASISRRVVEMKAALEKIRELVQNVE